MTPAIRLVSSGWASHWNRKPTTSSDPTVAVAASDPRITFVEPLDRYVMSYTAFSPRGPRIALAVSEDLFAWQRLGLASFGPYDRIEFDDVDDKDASLFPVAIPDPSGHPELAILVVQAEAAGTFIGQEVHGR